MRGRESWMRSLRELKITIKLYISSIKIGSKQQLLQIIIMMQKLILKK